MKYLLLTVWCSVSFSSFAFAQESVGFSDPENIRPLLDYRLPDWGYTHFFWDFSLNGNLSKNESDNHQMTSKNNQYSGRLSPTYFRYRESEPRITSYSFMPFADISVEDRSFSPNNEDYRRYFKFNINWRLDEKIYLSDTDFFINGVSSGNFRQSSTHIKLTSPQSMVNEENFLYRNFSTNFTLGVGYGRLRGVNPMMRALRLNERLNTLETGQALSNTDLFYAAEQFAKFNGYQQAYDRPDKHFWGDMDNLLSANFAGLDTFDMLYLTDTTAEPLGFRREGWQILASAGILYSIQYDPSENDDDTQTNRNSYLTPGISGSWFKNLSLKHQIGLQGSYQFLAVIGSSPGSDINFINSSANWIFTITDRILTNTTAGYTRRSRANMVTNTISIDADINYFIENRFSLFTNFRFMKNSTDVDTVPGMHLVAIDDQMFIFNAGIRYFMRRSLH